MKFEYESELMKNQKHASVMAPGIAFDVAQTSNGNAIFFSIGTDNVLYVTSEVPKTGTGWAPCDLSSTLSASHSSSAVVAKSFAVAQNAEKSSKIDIALVLTVGGADFLYLSTGNSNDRDAWTNISWALVPFDAPNVTVPSPLIISDVYLMSPSGVSPLNCFVDILRNPNSPIKVLDRYFIQPHSSPQWCRHALAADLVAGSISSCLGHRTRDRVPGIYTFGMIGTKKELLFTPQYNIFSPPDPPSPSRLTVPTGATAICSALNSKGNTNLFVAAPSGLFLFTPDNQRDHASPVQVAKSNIFNNVSALSALTASLRTTVWGFNVQGDLFQLFCPAGHESQRSAWSAPVRICTGARQFAFYLNQVNAATSIIFVQLANGHLIQLSQDPVTTSWNQRSILLPSTSISDVKEYNSFTTHIQVTDDYGFNSPNVPVQLTSTSLVTVYINDAYYVLCPGIVFNLAADDTGTITVIQETQSLAAACFSIISPSGSQRVIADINPLSKAMKTLSTIESGDDLGNVRITTANGVHQPLVPSSTSSSDMSAAARFISRAVKISATLPSDGSAKTKASTPSENVQSCGLSFGQSGVTYHEQDPFSDANNILDVAAGDLFQWFKDCYDVVESFIIRESKGFYYAVVKIGDQLYKALLNCVSAVTGAIEFVFRKIGVFFEHLIAWLGFLFQWEDIKRTHRVMKNIFKCYASRVTSEIDQIEIEVTKAFGSLRNNVNAWAHLTNTGKSIGASAAPSRRRGSRSPQSNWALYHTKNNISSAKSSYTQPDASIVDPLNEAMKVLNNLVGEESDALKIVVQEIQSQIMGEIRSLTPAEIICKLIAIFADLAIDTAKNVIVAALDVIKIIATSILALLDAPIDIPIISSLYKTISGDDLTFLDLVCLVGAIPVTIIFKIVAGTAPYPDDSLTKDLINAADFAAISNLLTNNNSASVPSQMCSLGSEAIGVAANTISTASSASVPVSALDATCAVLNFGASFGSLLTIGLSTSKRFSSGDIKVVRCAAAASYLLYVAPNYSGLWKSPSSGWVKMNDAITILSIAKTFVDNYFPDESMWGKIAPILESVINFVWVIPAIGSFAQTSQPKLSDETSLASNIVFDVGGMLTFLTSSDIFGEEVADPVFALVQLCSLIYATLCLVTGGVIEGSE